MRLTHSVGLKYQKTNEFYVPLTFVYVNCRLDNVYSHERFIHLV